MSLINIKNLTFCYEGSYNNIFENVTFQIDTDWKLGLIGRNGRGKTTFLNLLMEKYDYKGNIFHKINFEYFPYIISDKSLYTIDVINKIYNGYKHWQLLKEFNLLDVDENVLYRPFNTLSNGEQTKALIAVLFLKENSFLLIDEPTNHLDYEGRKKVSDYLKSKKGFILVSHDRQFLDNCIDHVLSINKTNIEVSKGDFSIWWENKVRQDNFEIAQKEKYKKEITRLNEASKRKADWSKTLEKTKYNTDNSGIKPDRGFIGHKAAKLMKSSLVMEARMNTALEEKRKLLKNIETTEKLKIHQLEYHSDKLISCQDLSIYYDNTSIVENINFTLLKGDRLALIGKNGSGKSSILKLICGFDIDYTGDLYVGSQLKISYVSQSAIGIKGDLSSYALENDLDESLFKAILRKLDFSRTQFDKDIAYFSAGQKKKVLIAKSLCERAHLYIWDEPMNFIDVFSRMQIEELLLEYKPTIIFVEHDSVFCKKLANKTVKL